MKKLTAFFAKPYRFATGYTILLILASVLISLYTFVLPHGTVKVDYAGVSGASDTYQSKQTASDGLDENGYGFWEKEATVNGADETYTSRGYTDENIAISITQYRRIETDIYVADIKLKSAEYLKAAFAEDTFGVHITEYTSDIAKKHNALLAINGDYFGYHTESFVLRNGIVYRDAPRTDDLYDDLIVGRDGSFTVIEETEGAMKPYLDSAWQVFGFGPSLLWNKEVVTGEKTEVARCKASNPRTCIGRYETGEDGMLHYCFVTSDGRTEKSAGLTLYQLAGFLQEIGCTDGYNMDGGGSTTLVFNDEVINQPTNGNYGIKERGVSDIVYIGY